MVDADLEAGAKTLVVGYGVTCRRGAGSRGDGPALRRGGVVMVVQSLWPVPERALAEALDGVETVIVPELNLGQYRREVERLAAGRGSSASTVSTESSSPRSHRGGI